MKKEICIDARMALSSGIGTYIRSLIPMLKDEYRIRLISSEEVANYCPEFEGCDVIPSKAWIYTLSEQLELPLKIPKCDLFWSPHFNIPLSPIRAEKRLVTIHDVFFLAHPEHLGIHKKTYARIMMKMAAKKSDHVITDSVFSQKEIEKYLRVNKRKLSTILCGVNQDDFKEKGEFEKFPLPSRYLLYVGNLAIHKNIQRLIQSLDFLPDDVHLVLAGNEKKLNSWKEEFFKRKNRVTICGKVEKKELIWLYQNAEALIHPSYYEGFGFSPLEAMSAGCPVVASRIASIPEVCGDAAIYIDPFCVNDIAKGIASVWKNDQKRKELREKGVERARQFDWKISAKKHVEVIDQIINA